MGSLLTAPGNTINVVNFFFVFSDALGNLFYRLVRPVTVYDQSLNHEDLHGSES